MLEGLFSHGNSLEAEKQFWIKSPDTLSTAQKNVAHS